MILVTGGTGFVGQALIRHLLASGKQVRTLLRPSKESPRLPRGIGVEAAVCSLRDERGLKAAMRDVDVVYHLAGTERHSSRAELHNVDVLGSEGVAAAAASSGVRQIIYLSHLGADRHSAYKLLQAKALAEAAVINSGVPYTIMRSAVAYGPADQFTTSILRLLRLSPGVFFLPGDGSSLLQPIWIEDLVYCLSMTMEDQTFANQVISIGGLETISFRQVVEMIMQISGVRRSLVRLSPPSLRNLAVFLEQFGRFPVSYYWLEYLAADRTTQLDSVPRMFGIMPARFHTQLGYLTAAKRQGSRQRGYVL